MISLFCARLGDAILNTFLSLDLSCVYGIVAYKVDKSNVVTKVIFCGFSRMDTFVSSTVRENPYLS